MESLLETEMHCYLLQFRVSESSRGLSVCHSNCLLLKRAALTGLAVLLANEQEKLSWGGLTFNTAVKRYSRSCHSAIISMAPCCSTGSQPDQETSALMEDVVEQNELYFCFRVASVSYQNVSPAVQLLTSLSCYPAMLQHGDNVLHCVAYDIMSHLI